MGRTRGHPDVAVYFDYTDKEKPAYLRLVSVTTKEFPHGLSLAGRYEDKKTAEAGAVLVQKYVDALSEALKNRKLGEEVECTEPTEEG